MTEKATLANAPTVWDGVYQTPEAHEWRPVALAKVYDRIAALCPHDSIVLDVGGGIGTLAAILEERTNSVAMVAEHSQVACERVRSRGMDAHQVDLENGAALPQAAVVVATEVLEHLTPGARDKILRHAVAGGVGFFSVPNNRLGPEECPEHRIKFTAKTFLDYLRGHFGDACRVECIDSYLLGICGTPAVKQYRLSVCLPARDEAADIEKTLASFRGVADELIVGVDPRTVDATREIAALYADVVFDIADPLARDCEECPEDVPDEGVHFGQVRNECLDKCTGEWVFMTEAHEYLGEGQDILLHLDEVIPEHARVAFVFREGNKQQWAFPWLCENAPDLRYKRATHNVLDYPVNTYVVQLPQVRTIHERVHAKEEVRAEQRKIQNRLTLYRDWLKYGNENSLHYLGSEWREHDPDKAIGFMKEYLRQPPKNGAMRYHTRLLLAKQLMLRNESDDMADARATLLGATEDDWARTEHWVWLGDLAFDKGDFEEAARFFGYAATTIGAPPFTLWWIDLAHYGWIPAQRLAMTFGALNKAHDALFWAQRVVDLLPEDAEEARAEALANIQILEDAINE